VQPPTSSRSVRLACVGIALLSLAACSAGAAGSTPTWVPQPNFQGSTDPQPQLPGNGLAGPQPSAPGSGAPQPGPTSPGGAPSAGQSGTTDPSVVATKLNQPTGLVVLPDGTALVGERRTGRILRVQPQPGQPAQPVQTLAGVDPAGDGGLLDLALSPTYNQDGLIYAYLTTATDNRVIHFALGSLPSPVIAGIPKGSTGNVGRIAFDGTGALLTGTGDAGQPALAAQPNSLAGKILRTNDIGRPMPDNPTPGSPVYASGLRTVDGLCVDPRSGLRMAVSAGQPDEVNQIRAGADYGWPQSGPGSTGPSKTLPASSPGGAGCALTSGQLAVVTTSGMSLLVAPVSQNATIGTFTTSLHAKYGRLRSVVAGPDGALWLTTSNRDGQGKPTADDDRVIRITASANGGNSVL
jgi:glucose/arabinose dehydrogenase